MIDGITVLAQKTIQIITGQTWGFSSITILGILLVLAGIGVIVIMFVEKDHDFLGWSMSIVFILVSIITWHCKDIKIDCQEYKALMDETVSFTEFDSKYVLTGHDGEIYIFRERIDGYDG